MSRELNWNRKYQRTAWQMTDAGKLAARLGGLVIDAGVRDGALLEEVGFPVFSRGLCIRGTGKDFGATGWLNKPVLMGDIFVSPGDLIVGDIDGVVSIPMSGLMRCFSPPRNVRASRHPKQRLCLQVRFQTQHAVLAPDARLLESAERRQRIVL